ncbi:MAG: DUF2808 domain-containing protein [Cyanobacteria bacterium Co-bin8]|nr:DUF2808 domain-containing protein [Cyanobacteria bacterium Co-bin8]
MTHTAIQRSALLAVAGVLTATAGLALMPSLRLLAPAAAVELAQQPTSFVQQPRLIESSTTRNLVSQLNATYYVTLDLPAGADAGLQTVQIRLTEGRDPIFRFRPDDTQVFEGTRYDRGTEIPVGVVTQDRDENTLTVQLDPAVLPGRTVTLALRPERNPRFEGIYLFEVTAFPAGEQVQPRFTGYARLHFYHNDRDRRLI